MVFTDPAEQESWARASLVVQWLRLCAPNAGGPGLIPGQGTRSHIQQLRSHMPKDPMCSQINKLPGTLK